jgi:transcriptional regulator with XRE-family HTH domain
MVIIDKELYMFPDRMVALMKQKKITKKQICADVGIGINQIKYWETNHNIPDADVVQKIADYLGTNASYLLELGTEHEFLQTFAQEKDPPKISESEEQLLALFREVPEADQEMVLMMIQSALSSRKSAKATEEIASNITRTAASIQRPRTFGMYRGRAGAGIPVSGMKVYRGKSNETEAAEIIARRKKVSK